MRHAHMRVYRLCTCVLLTLQLTTWDRSNSKFLGPVKARDSSTGDGESSDAELVVLAAMSRIGRSGRRMVFWVDQAHSMASWFVHY